MHAVEQQVDVGKLMQSLEYVIPAEGEEMTIGLLVCRIEVGDGKTKSHQIVLLVNHKTYKVEIDEREVLADIHIDFLFGKGDEIVQIFKGRINRVEELTGIGVHLFARLEMEHPQVVLLHD